MSIGFKLTGFDDLFNETITPKFIVNDHDGTDNDVKEHIDNLVFNNIVGDNLSLIPSCMCGELKGAYYLGEICPNAKCGTPVANVIEDKLTYLVWVRQPKGVAKLITPFFYNILLNRYKISSPPVALVEYITQTNLRITGRNMRNIEQLEKLDFILKDEGIEKGYNSFVNNFMRIIEILELNFVTKGRKQDRLNFIEWVRENHHNWFSGYIPIPNRSLFVLDRGDDATYMDREILSMLNAVRRMTGIDISDNNSMTVQNKTAKFLSDLVKFYTNYFQSNIFKKQGIIRKHITRARSHFTIRAVVTSITTPHRYDEIHLPWSVACSIFREHILKCLMQERMTYREAMKYFMSHINKYSEKINNIFVRLLNETGDGYPALLNRNPSLHRGSILSVRVTRVKPDPEDNTMSVSYLLSPVLNMDFDGDMLHLTLLFTKKSIKHAENFELKHSVLGLRSPNEYSSAISFPKSIVGNLSYWLDSEEV